MNVKCKLLLVVVVHTVLALVLPVARGGEVLDQSFMGAGGSLSRVEDFAQSFTVGLPGTLSSVEVELFGAHLGTTTDLSASKRPNVNSRRWNLRVAWRPIIRPCKGRTALGQRDRGLAPTAIHVSSLRDDRSQTVSGTGSVLSEIEGATFDVMNRGDRREPIFRDDADRKRFLEILEEACAIKEAAMSLSGQDGKWISVSQPFFA